MKIINLALTTDKLQIKLAGNVTATQLDWTCSFYDITTADGTVLEGASTGTTNNTTAVDICAAPATGHTRTVKSITVYNADSATAVPIILFNANGTVRVLVRNSLTTLASWSTDDMSFYTDISGKLDTIANASAAETTTGTSTSKFVTPDGFAGSDYGKRIIQIKLVDDATALTTGDGKLIFVVPVELNGYNLVQAEAMVSTVSSSGTPTYQIRNVTDSQDMLSTRITIDASEFTSYTAATRSVVNTANDDVATGDRIAIDKDVAGTGEKGDTIVLSFQLP